MNYLTDITSLPVDLQKTFSAVEQLPTPIALFNSCSAQLVANQALLGLIQKYSIENLALFVPSALLDEDVTPTSIHSRYEVKIQTLGNPRWYGVDVSALNNEPDSHWYYFSYFDLTQYKKRQLEHGMFKGFAQWSPAGLVISRIDTSQIVYVNPCMKDMLEEPLALRALRRRIFSYYTPASAQTLESEIFPLVKEQGYWRGELELLTAKGNMLPTVEHFFLIRDEQGEAQYISNLVINNYQQKALEQQLIQAKDAAEQAASAKSMFLANMSHEIRTPLNAVLGYAQLLVEDDSLNDAQSEKLKAIFRSGNLLLNLINDILDVSKMEAGVIELNTEVFDLYEFMEDWSVQTKERCDEKSLDFRYRCGVSQPCLVRGDVNKLSQVLINLISNAVKFTDNGYIAIDFVAQGNDRYLFQIIDTGPGISEEGQQRLFRPFQQELAGEIKGGTGLGLHISKGLALLMGGGLELTSALGRGSTVKFSVHLPSAPESEYVKNRVFNGVPHLKNGVELKVLIVDDDEDNRIVLSETISRIGIYCDFACDGLAAIEKVRDGYFDLVLMDIRMPRMDGMQATAAIRDLSLQHQPPIVAVTASSLEQQREFFLANGFADFISKPYKVSDVYRMLAAVLQVELIDDNSVDDSKTEHIEQPKAEFKMTATILDYLESLALAADAGDLNQVRHFMSKLTHIGIHQAEWFGALEQHYLNYDFDLLAILVRQQVAKELN